MNDKNSNLNGLVKELGSINKNIKKLSLPRILVIASLLLVVITVGFLIQRQQQIKNSSAATAVAGCWPSFPLAGALPGQPYAIWCYSDLVDGPSTVVKGNNTWVDEFNHGLSFSKFDTQNYTDFPITGSLYKSQLWRHGNHWMRDIAGSDQGGEGSGGWNFGLAAMRPNATFKAENGQLTIEAEVATRIADYGANLFWPEVVITTGDKPTQIRSNGTYVYEAFPNHWTFGCRLQNDGGFTCAILDNTDGGDSTARVTELSHFQCGNSPGAPYSANYQCHSIYGGLPSNLPADIAQYSRDCKDADPDTNCRDRWRWEITENRSTWFVNGVKYMEHTDFDPGARTVIRNLINQPLYVYFGEFLYKLDEPARMHWDRIAINPKDASGNILPPSAVPGFCLPWPQCLGTGGTNPTPTTAPTATTAPNATNTPVPTATPTSAVVVPTNTPIPAGSGEITINFNDKNTGTLNGIYPTGLIKWGSNRWYVSAPWRKFDTKSLSFNGGSIKSASISFVTPRVLKRLDAYADTATTVTLSCSGSPRKTIAIPAKSLVTISTGWTKTCSGIIIASTNGWDTNFDNLVLSN